MLDNEILRNQLVSRRAFLIGSGKLSLLSLLVLRMFYMQFVKQDVYKTLSDKNSIRLIPLSPLRGNIYDINANLLATNQTCFRLLLDRPNKQNYKDELDLIVKILTLSEEQKLYILKKITNSDKRSPVIILDQLNWSQISILEEHKPNLNHILIDQGESRFYPYTYSISHLIGYIGQVSEKELQELRLNNRDFNVGKSGVEKYYENLLRGEFGYKQMEVNAFGKHIRELSCLKSKQGNDLRLNIDAVLQEKIHPFLNKQGCSAIVMDSNNGNILIFSSSPSFNPNNFIKLSQDYWDSLIKDPYKPLINKGMQNNYPPGSPFKLITVLAALEFGLNPDKRISCIGGVSALGTNSFRCHSKQGHGNLDMIGAIKYSCNAYMYEIARQIGPDAIIATAKKFGFGEATGIDLFNEVSGLVPSKKWKKDRFKSQWTIGDTFNLCIGQGFLLSSPIQLARFAAAIANGGKLYTPRLAKNEPSFRQIDVKQEHLDIIKEGMYQAVNSSGGSAYSSRILNSNFELAGKTGTSQVQSKANANDDLSRDSISWERRNHAVFVGFAPYQNPRYSVSVFVDHGGGGGRAAAPIARRIMSEILEKYNSG